MAIAQGPNVFDVLEMLPLPLVDSEVWGLLGHRGQHDLKKVCRQGQQLADLLTTSVTHDLNRGRLDESEADDTDVAWQQAFQRLSVTLARLPRLVNLELQNWVSESDLALALVEYGVGTQRRAKSLVLDHTAGRVSGTSARAISLTCPQLQHLALGVSEEELPSDDILVVDGPFFLPLHGLATLTKFVGLNNCSVTGDALHSLGGMFHLHHLELCLKSPLRSHLRRLTATCAGLVSLRHCTLHRRHQTPSASVRLTDVSALFSLTQLTHFHVPLVRHGAHSVPSAGADLDAAVALLAALSQLCDLNFGDQFDVDSAVLMALSRMPRLTRLSVGRFCPTHSSPGHLPQLQSLQISSLLKPSQVLQTLQPLLPLPALKHLTSSSMFQGVGNVSTQFCVNVGFATSVEADAGAVAMREVSEVLARRGVLLEHVALTRHASLPCHLSLQQVGDSLAAHVTHLRGLQLSGFGLVDCDWGMLGSLFPATPEVLLSQCRMSDASLCAIPRGFASLQARHVLECTGLSAAGWLELAAGCPRPLQLSVHHAQPGPPAALQLWCEAVERGAHGHQALTWVKHRGLAAPGIT